MISLMFLPILGWTGGTFLGATASTLLPVILRDSLGIMIYGMFLAIIIPPCRTSKNIGIVVLMAAVTSCLFQVLSAYISIGSGFVIILCTLFAAGVGAFLFPIDGEEQR